MLREEQEYNTKLIEAEMYAVDVSHISSNENVESEYRSPVLKKMNEMNRETKIGDEVEVANKCTKVMLLES